MHKYLPYTKILLCLVFAFLIADISTKELFVAGTPKLRDDTGERLAMAFQGLTTGSFIAKKNDAAKVGVAGSVSASAEQELKDTPFTQLVKGVYAKENSHLSYTVIKENEIVWREYRIFIKGKMVKVKVPEQEEALSQNALEKLHE
ncbi:MAG: hypothetical protein Q7S61_04995 [bacterium]|nr:hypothetical protein [bacterium]